MNKTEPVRERDELRDLGSSELPGFASSEVTNSEGVRPNESMAGGVPDFQTSPLADSAISCLPNSETSALTNGVSS
jgi:hypothetical protein